MARRNETSDPSLDRVGDDRHSAIGRWRKMQKEEGRAGGRKEGGERVRDGMDPGNSVFVPGFCWSCVSMEGCPTREWDPPIVPGWHLLYFRAPADQRS